VLLATELAQRETSVILIDADPNQPVLRWSRKPGKPENLAAIGGVTEDALIGFRGGEVGTGSRDKGGLVRGCERG